MFIDEIHSIVGAGDSDGLDECCQHHEARALPRADAGHRRDDLCRVPQIYRKDSALERRFQPVKVEEPSLLDTIEVIKGIRVYYEKHHCVRVPDPIVTSIVKLSERYITDRFLPDKAIDLLTRPAPAAATCHPEITELIETQRTVADLEAREHELENPERRTPGRRHRLRGAGPGQDRFGEAARKAARPAAESG